MDKKEQFINELQRIHLVLDRTPTSKEYDQYTTIPKGKIDTLRRLFGSYSLALKEAGLIPIKDCSIKGVSNIPCTECNNVFTKSNTLIAKGQNHFCSQSCSASFNNKLNPKRIKTTIDSPYKGLGSTEANRLKDLKQYNEYVIKWKQGLEDGVKGLSTSSYIKRFMLIKYDYKCSECGWNKLNPYTNKIPLELEHIDGDYTNNNESNLTILCPSCHSLTATYKGANRDKGTRTKR